MIVVLLLSLLLLLVFSIVRVVLVYLQRTLCAVCLFVVCLCGVCLMFACVVFVRLVASSSQTIRPIRHLTAYLGVSAYAGRNSETLQSCCNEVGSTCE